MVHSGSLSIGATAGFHIDALLRQAYPKGLKKPHSGFYPLYGNEPEIIRKAIDTMGNAINFASLNRLMMELMTLRALSESIRDVTRFHMIYDAGHNYIERLEDGSVIHRKGACRVRSGEHVIIPGSMGSGSFLMPGLSNEDALSSACHGAGRAFSRGRSMKAFEADFEAFLKEFMVVTPVDFDTARSDIKMKKPAELRQEAPSAYKAITPAIETVKDSGIATPVAEFFSLMTVKA